MRTIGDILVMVRDAYGESPFVGLCRVAGSLDSLTLEEVVLFKRYVFDSTDHLGCCYTIGGEKVDREFGQYVWPFGDRVVRFEWLNREISKR